MPSLANRIAMGTGEERQPAGFGRPPDHRSIWLTSRTAPFAALVVIAA
jgi:hypothetical protein